MECSTDKLAAIRARVRAAITRTGDFKIARAAIETLHEIDAVTGKDPQP